MSYEGYVQKICGNGHYFRVDAYDDCSGPWADGEKPGADNCPVCGKEAVWRNSVDETNGENYGFIDLTPYEIHPHKRTEVTELDPDTNLWVTEIVIEHGVYRIPEPRKE